MEIFGEGPSPSGFNPLRPALLCFMFINELGGLAAPFSFLERCENLLDSLYARKYGTKLVHNYLVV